MGPTESRTWTVDTTAPAVRIDGGPAGTVAHTGATFEFGSEPDASFECRRDDQEWNGCASPRDYAELAEGEHTFRVRAIDAAGNTGEPDVRTWTVDTTGPATTIDGGPDGTVSRVNATFEFSAPAGASFECRRDDQEWNACASPKDYADLADGEHTFRVRATNANGNTGEPEIRSWTVDITGPTVTIDSGPSGRVSRVNATFEFSSGANTTFECKFGAGDDFGPCTSPVELSGLSEGEHLFRVRGTDELGNVGAPESRTWNVDNAAPATTIGQKPDKSTTAKRAVFGFDANEPVDRFECRRDEQADWHACTSPHEYTDLGLGGHTFRVRAVDRAANVGAADAYDWTIVAPPPTCTTTTVTVEANADSWILQSSAAKNYGNESNVKVTTKTNDNARGVFRFPLPAMPAGCVVTDAKLRLFANSWKTGRTLEAIRLAAGWKENEIDLAQPAGHGGQPRQCGRGQGLGRLDRHGPDEQALQRRQPRLPRPRQNRERRWRRAGLQHPRAPEQPPAPRDHLRPARLRQGRG